MSHIPSASHHRRSIRLRDYDYTQAGVYFVTICTHQRACLFGSILDGGMTLNDWGDIVRAEWQQTAVQRPYVELDLFVVMPNHMHGILLITQPAGRGMMHHAPTDPTSAPRQFAKPIAHSLATIVGTYKAAVTRRVNRMQNLSTTPVWQRNYYEHIIRDEDDLNRIRAYIETNPARWQEDSLYTPQRVDRDMMGRFIPLSVEA